MSHLATSVGLVIDLFLNEPRGFLGVNGSLRIAFDKSGND
jgi:hypothetical protein